jgi:signal transduction histidine kinase
MSAVAISTVAREAAMTSRSELRRIPGETPSDRRSVAVSILPSRQETWILAGSLVLLHLANPLAWGDKAPHLWFPAAGLALCLVAWFGWRAALAVGLSQLLVLSQALAFGFLSLTTERTTVALTASEAVLTALEAVMAWQVYHQVAKGARNLGDPRSAIVFLFTVPGAVLGAFALIRALLWWWSAALPSDPTFSLCLAWQWLSRSLGVLAVAPPLLATLTPWLVRRQWAIVEVFDDQQSRRREHLGADHLTRGDWIEIAGLALGASVLGVFLAVTHQHKELSGWQLWGSPVLLIVWASLRQGLRGGTIVAGAAASLPLILLAHRIDVGRADPITLLLQGNLLAQCATGLLVAASASWIQLNEARYRQVMAHVPVVVYSGRIVDLGLGHRPPRAEVILVSAASGWLFGCPPEELLGPYDRWLQHVHPDDCEVLLAALTQLTRQNQPVTCEYRLAPAESLRRVGEGDSALAAKPGSSLLSVNANPPNSPHVRYVRDTLAPQLDRDGKLVGWEGVVTDITEQRILADDLRRTTSMFHTLVANLPTGVFFVAGSRGRPVVVNARARQLLGQREDVSTGLDHHSSVYRLFRPDGTPYPVEELPVYLALRRGMSTMCDDIVVHRPDGRRVPLIAWGAPVSLGSGEGHDAAVWVFEDLTVLHQAETARRNLEQELQRSQRLELIGRLSSGIVHDFNNLLSVVMNLAELARQNLEPDHAVHQELQQIHKASQLASGLAAQLLAFSKNRKVATTRFDLNSLVKRTLALLHASMPSTIQVEAVLHEGVLAIEADETQLQQVLMNLCLNARDAMPQGGRLQVRTEPAPRNERRWVRLSVHDEGHGMPENVRSKVFDLFFTTKEHGTGLGLAVVQQIVESYHGVVEVHSEPGQGATFEVWLPLA